MELMDKLRILADSAKYDAACTSSGSDRKAGEGSLGGTMGCGICHSFSADGRCISLLKVLMTNSCVYDCQYCVNRRSNDIPGPPSPRRSWRSSPSNSTAGITSRGCSSAPAS